MTDDTDQPDQPDNVISLDSRRSNAYFARMGDIEEDGIVTPHDVVGVLTDRTGDQAVVLLAPLANDESGRSYTGWALTADQAERLAMLLIRAAGEMGAEDAEDHG